MGRRKTTTTNKDTNIENIAIAKLKYRPGWIHSGSMLPSQLFPIDVAKSLLAHGRAHLISTSATATTKATANHHALIPNQPLSSFTATTDMYSSLHHLEQDVKYVDDFAQTESKTIKHHKGMWENEMVLRQNEYFQELIKQIDKEED